MTAGDLNKLSVFHTKSLRRILRIFWPKTISNGQLLDRCRQDIMETIRELKMETFSGRRRPDWQRKPGTKAAVAPHQK